jgi:large repetitive protein
VHEIDRPEAPLVAISTRGRVGTGDNVMIGGFIIQGTGQQTVVIRAIGPSLANHGVTGSLADPTLQLVRLSDAATIAFNNDWGTAANAAQIQASGFAPAHPSESAILVTLGPGAYTAILSGLNGATGVGLVEVYKVGP